MTDQPIEGAGEEFKDLVASAPDTKVAPSHGIAAIALSMALKFHDINTVQDGVLYQQYKMEGKNLTPLYLDAVFETAIRIELHLLGASDRIAKVLVEALTVVVDDEPDAEEDTAEEAQEPIERGDSAP